jgi:hypothetical protein
MNEYLDESKQQKLSMRMEQNLLNVDSLRRAREMNISQTN